MWETIEDMIQGEVQQKAESEWQRFLQKFELSEDEVDWELIFNEPYIRLKAKKVLTIAMKLGRYEDNLEKKVIIINKLEDNEVDPSNVDKFSDFSRALANILAAAFGGEIKVVADHDVLKLVVVHDRDAIIISEVYDDC